IPGNEPHRCSIKCSQRTQRKNQSEHHWLPPQPATWQIPIGHSLFTVRNAIRRDFLSGCTSHRASGYHETNPGAEIRRRSTKSRGWQRPTANTVGLTANTVYRCAVPVFLQVTHHAPSGAKE